MGETWCMDTWEITLITFLVGRPPPFQVGKRGAPVCWTWRPWSMYPIHIQAYLKIRKSGWKIHNTRPVGLNSQGKRVCNDCNFLYQGCKVRKGRGYTIGQVLQVKKYLLVTGIDAFTRVYFISFAWKGEMLQEGDTLLFHPPLLTIFGVEGSGIGGDTRESYTSMLVSYQTSMECSWF